MIKYGALQAYNFHWRIQQKEETAAKYMAKLQKLAKKCEFKDYFEETS